MLCNSPQAEHETCDASGASFAGKTWNKAIDLIAVSGALQDVRAFCRFVFYAYFDENDERDMR